MAWWNHKRYQEETTSQVLDWDCEPGSSVSIVSGYGLDDRGSIPGKGERIFPAAFVSRPALGPTHPPVQWVPRVLFPGLKRGRDVTLTTHPHLVPRSRMNRSYTSLPPSAFVACSGTAFRLRLTYIVSAYSIIKLYSQCYPLSAVPFYRQSLVLYTWIPVLIKFPSYEQVRILFGTRNVILHRHL
jgi:hypothetical protein